MMFRKTIAALAFSALTFGSAQALTIDTFNFDQTVSSTGGLVSDVVSDAASILGIEREASINQLGPGGSASTIAFNTGLPGFMTLGNTNALSVTNIVYDGIGSAGLGGIDFTQGASQNAFNLFIVSGDFPTDVTLTVSSASGTSALTLSTPGLASNVPFIFEYSDFTGTADFSLAESIQIQLVTTNTQADLQLDFFGTTSTIPEPMTLAILGLGLAGLSFARKRRA